MRLTSALRLYNTPIPAFTIPQCDTTLVVKSLMGCQYRECDKLKLYHTGV